MRMGLEMGSAGKWSHTPSALLSELCFNLNVEIPEVHGGQKEAEVPGFYQIGD